MQCCVHNHGRLAITSSSTADLVTDLSPTTSRTARSLSIIGDHWTLLILNEAFLGVRRFGELKASLGISDSVLSGRLRSMVTDGLLNKRLTSGSSQPEYHLTTSGSDTWKIFVAAWAWEQDWNDESNRGDFLLSHKPCGSLLRPILVCGKCGEAVEPRSTSVIRSASKLGYIEGSPRRHRQRKTIRSNRSRGFAPTTMALLGDRWNTAVASGAAIGLRRFSEFERFLGIAPAVLSDRLGTFVELGIFRASLIGSKNDRVEYRLTARGRAFSAVLLQIVEWSERNVKTGEPRSMLVRHDTCGKTLRPDLHCSTCDTILRRADVLFERRTEGT